MDKIALNTLNQIQENELVEFDSLRMQDKRDESEIYIYPLIELVNNKFTNRILVAGDTWPGLAVVLQVNLPPSNAVEKTQ